MDASRPLEAAGAAGRPGYPAAPWVMRGQLWLSLFRLGEPVDTDRPAGTYGAAFVGYQPGSVLTYSELLVARRVAVPGERGRRVSIVDIWVDSVASMRGGRELWAIPKDLCDFRFASTRRGPFSTTDWSATVQGRPIAHASFRDLSRAAPRTPLRGTTWQPGLAPEAAPSSASFTGSARSLPCRGRWQFDPRGPLAWLRRARPVASLRICDFRMTFG